MTEKGFYVCHKAGYCYILWRFPDGGRSSVGRAPDCGSGCRGFEPRRSPHYSHVQNICDTAVNRFINVIHACLTAETTAGFTIIPEGNGVTEKDAKRLRMKKCMPASGSG